MENVRIAVLSAYDKVLCFMDNEAPGAMHYWNDELHEYLKGAASTLTLTVTADSEEALHLSVGNHLSFIYRGKSYYLNIMHTEQGEDELSVEAYSLSFELLNEESGAYKSPSAMSVVQYLNVFDPEHTLTVGINEVESKRISHEWDGATTVLARLYSLANVFSAEVEFVPVLNKDYSLQKTVINIYKQHSDKEQGIGKDRSDFILRYGKNVEGITKTSDITEMYTAIRPTGTDGLMVYDLDKTEKDAKGQIEYRSPRGDGCIRAVQARDRFPSNLMGSSDRYITVGWEYETTNAEMLYGQALAELKKHCVPQVEYDVSGYFDTGIGDTVTIADEEYNPELYLRARVSEQIRSFTDKTRNKTVFSNFEELQSEVNAALLLKVQQMIAENKVYTCMISSDNGTVFKNGTGYTTLTASVMDGGKDMTDKFTLQWYKDGVEIYIGKSITIPATEVSGKSVYRFNALDAKSEVKGFYEVTLVNVFDGSSAKTCNITGMQVMKYESGNLKPKPSSLVLTAEYRNTRHMKWQYKDAAGAWRDFSPAETSTTISVTERSIVWIEDTAIIRAMDESGEAIDTMTLAKLRDGTNGSDAILLHVDSVNGYIFKNTGVATILTVTVIIGNNMIDSSQKLRESFGENAKILWEYKKMGETKFSPIAEDDPRVSDHGFIFTLSADDVNGKLTFNCNLDF